MLNRLKDGARITDQDPVFKARYIGKTETFTAAGKGCTTPLVQKLWDNSEEERFLKRVQVRITTSGIHMTGLEKKKEREVLFQIENITFCTVDTAVNDRIFAWIYKAGEGVDFDCHAIVCSSSEKAKSMALVLSRAFQIAYKEWKASQIRSVRNDEMKQRSVSMGKLSLPTKWKGQRSQSVVEYGDSGSPKTSVSSTANRLARTLSEPSGPKGVEKEPVNESVQASSDLVYAGPVSREIGIQADSEKL